MQTPKSATQRAGTSGTVLKPAEFNVAAVESAGSIAPGAAPPPQPGQRAPRKRTVAVFMAHGMGQQIPFGTLDQVAIRLRQLEIESGHPSPASLVRAVKFEDQWLHRIELELKAGTVETHVYEGYWAPLTEGKITVRGVIAFLAGAGFNGIKNGTRTFRRWLFREDAEFKSPIRTVLYLLFTMMIVGALVAMNTTIVLVSSARALLGQTPAWLTDGLFADLTTTFNAVVAAFAAFGATILIALLLRSSAPIWLRRTWALISIVPFAAALAAIALGGMCVMILIYGHVRADVAATDQLWHRIFSANAVDAFNRSFDYWMLLVLVWGGAVVLARWVAPILWGIARDVLFRKGGWLTLLVTIALVGLIGGAAILVSRFVQVLHAVNGGEVVAVIRSGLAWPVLVVVSMFIRGLLIQYAGDVAIYVSPYKLDTFFHLRDEIKKSVERVLRAVYSLKREDDPQKFEYDEVIVLGHSLGSVVVYDALNRLINDDEATGRTRNVVARTPLLLTFGSPLDKTAFVFAVQGQGTHNAREALAAAVQPLIQDYSFRPKKWVNIHSPWDIISGSLEFYDTPVADSNTKRVENLVDPHATTLLNAHVEYWNGPLLATTLYGAL